MDSKKLLTAIGVGMSRRKASVLYGIPRTILSDHKLGKVCPCARPGRPTYVVHNRGGGSCQLFVELAAIGYGQNGSTVSHYESLYDGLVEQVYLSPPYFV